MTGMNTSTVPTPHSGRPGHGFTLVELLVVIGIIALLISILLPTLASARRSANSIKCLSNQRQLGVALTFFTNDHEGWLPKAWFNDMPIPGGDTWEYRSPLWGWDYILWQYSDNSDGVFLCPSDSSAVSRGEWNDGTGDGGFSDQELLQDNLAASYRLNISNQPIDHRAYKISQLGNATSSIVISDAFEATWHQLESWDPVPIANGGQCSIGAGRDQIANAAPKRHTPQDAIFRGEGDSAVPVFKLNATFADGHGETVMWDRTFEPVGGAVSYELGNGDGFRSGQVGVGVPTMWRQIFRDGDKVDTYDNPNTSADDGNPFPG